MKAKKYKKSKKSKKATGSPVRTGLAPGAGTEPVIIPAIWAGIVKHTRIIAIGLSKLFLLFLSILLPVQLFIAAVCNIEEGRLGVGLLCAAPILLLLAWLSGADCED